ncbi:hypothetical protein BJV77DRAFT_717413 [Russula vinacea]|nr:hypothetical protein BJV77DRAFT_717413 [Russula vinacea]
MLRLATLYVCATTTLGEELPCRFEGDNAHSETNDEGNTCSERVRVQMNSVNWGRRVLRRAISLRTSHSQIVEPLVRNLSFSLIPSPINPTTLVTVLVWYQYWCTSTP